MSENGVLRGILEFKCEEVKRRGEERRGENYVKKSLIICTAHTVLFGC